MKYLVCVLLIIIIVFILILVIRAALFKPQKSNPVNKGQSSEPDSDQIAGHLSAMIQCETVSQYKNKDGYRLQFERFRELLKKQYPSVYERTVYERIGESGILFLWKGKKHDNPSVLMAHYDVVPADDGNRWENPAFSGLIKDGSIWGRGTLDTKCTLCAVMEASEHMMKEGFVPEHDIYLAFSGDEEIFGDSCPAIVSELEKRGCRPSFVLDEGGAIVSNSFPGVSIPSAMVGTAEKSSVNIEMFINSRGGHASTPAAHSDIGRLAKAVKRIEKHPFHSQLTVPVKNMFDNCGRYSGFALKLLFANIDILKGLFAAICRISGGELNAMMRSTCAFTMMEGSNAFNVIPSRPSIGMNLRLMGNDTVESAVSYLKKVVKDDRIEFRVALGYNPSVVSDTECEEYMKLKDAINGTYGDIIVTPYLMMASSDSRHYGRLTDKVYRFSGMPLSKDERKMIHGINEHISIQVLIKTVEFYIRLESML